MEKMPEWPVLSDAPYTHTQSYQADYERALRIAWESRCRVAVEALERYAAFNTERVSPVLARQTLAAIGPLPESPTTHNQEYDT